MSERVIFCASLSLADQKCGAINYTCGSPLLLVFCRILLQQRRYTIHRRNSTLLWTDAIGLAGLLPVAEHDDIICSRIFGRRDHAARRQGGSRCGIRKAWQQVMATGSRLAHTRRAYPAVPLHCLCTTAVAAACARALVAGTATCF